MILFICTIIVLGLYVALGKLLEDYIVRQIRGYHIYQLEEVGVANSDLSNDLKMKVIELSFWLKMGWPIFYLFSIGVFFGTELYKNLTKDNHENRIAAWFI